ncbi:hypothetical protein M433DRAFT_1100 [Acidomyces richmondensis BFW]|nr:MAG: hypothetical protein FE78DRAFT_482877 [Acidomyces sp. 'richmondensis']KYG49452.1 hypothetical protein M433DRAFT_1100 [Acidomyces richmondensis BFW]
MFQRRPARSIVFWSVTATSIVSQAVLAALVIKLTTLPFPAKTILHLALAACVLDVSSLSLFLIAIAARRLAPGVGLSVFYTIAVVFFVAAAAFSIYVLTWMLEHRNHDEASQQTLAAAAIALWIVACVVQVAFYGYLLWPPQHSFHVQNLQEANTRSSPTQAVKRSISIHLASLTPSPTKFNRSVSDRISPADSGYAASPKSSARNSMQQILRPITSRSRLVRGSFMSGDTSMHSTRPVSFDTVRQEDGFENWDTSGIADYNESPCRKKSTYALETIPGSRPVSPAKPLDGPFPNERNPGETALPDSPLQPPFPRRTSEASSMRSSSLPRPRRPSTNQSHIHPLFRSESPVPPPVASPGTVITASPYAGQIISSDVAISSRLLHSAQGSRPGSISPSSRPGSVRSFRTQGTSPEPITTSPLHESSLTIGG